MRAGSHVLLLCSSLVLLSCQKADESAPVDHSGSLPESASERQKITEKQGSQVLARLFDFEQQVIPESFQLHNATTSFVSNEGMVTSGEYGLRVQFSSKTDEHNAVAIVPEQPFDWSEYQDFSLVFDIANQGDYSTFLFVSIEDSQGQSYTRAINIPVGGSQSYYSKMDGHDIGSASNNEDQSIELNLSSGLRSNPETWQSDDTQMVWMWGTKNLDLAGIRRIVLRTEYNLHDTEITLDNIRLEANPPMDTDFLVGIVDKFGQNPNAEFAEKVHSEAELIAKKDAELLALNNGALMAERSKFSGWKAGPKLQATGYFRTEKVDGKWWLVDPEGYLYLATGVDIIRLANSTTMTGYGFDEKTLQSRDSEDVTPEDSQGLNPVNQAAQKTRTLMSPTRANMFEWLPASYDEPLGNHFGYRKDVHSGPIKSGEVYSFYSANLERKYGESSPNSFLQDWKQVTIDRMLNWGFTSLGNWTDPMFYDTTKVPYFANGWIIGDFKTVSSGSDFWRPLPDVFDPEFARRADVTLKTIADETQGSPWCVGVFIDNEKSWGRANSRQTELGIVINTLTRSGAEVPTKAEFTRVMKAKYADIDKLNAVWATDFDSWQAFDQGDFDSQLSAEREADYSLLLTTYAEQYFRIVRAALKQHLPNHMYFGVRFADWGMPKEVVAASAKYSDVVSFNNYKQGVTEGKWSFLPALDKPIMIGEFHFGAVDSGYYHPGLVYAANQTDRARMYQDYMNSVFDNDYFVGAHWFQYMDSPLTGRAYDGENYNVGFVTVADVPYEAMIKAAKALHGDMYQRRYHRRNNRPAQLKK
ncbi:beta-galactosidase [Neiella sp. HB171785]|uniref:Beta-galactosidase n=2 Tax=Neiella litorisoli TaxID=2771431 RepID=A0A8J6QUB6_9GAMM|nr:beta-galactosidase [Neiella litorisoli]